MLVDDVAAALPELRAQAEALMTSRGRIGTVTETLDPATNTLDPATNTLARDLAVVYEGPMRVYRARQSAVASAAGQQVTSLPLTCSVPWHVSAVTAGMVVVVDVSADPSLVGRELVVADVSRAESMVRRRLTVVDNQG